MDKCHYYSVITHFFFSVSPCFILKPETSIIHWPCGCTGGFQKQSVVVQFQWVLWLNHQSNERQWCCEPVELPKKQNRLWCYSHCTQKGLIHIWLEGWVYLFCLFWFSAPCRYADFCARLLIEIGLILNLYSALTSPHLGE